MRETLNARAMRVAIEGMNTLGYAEIVGGFAHDEANSYNAGDNFQGYIEKPWKWLDEIAEWVLDNRPALAAEYGLKESDTCAECYGSTDPYDGMLEHAEDCSKA